MPAAPLVSVVIPTFNSRDLLREALDALATQSLAAEAIEVIVVDDGSTDGTWEMLCELKLTRPNLHAFRQANAGRPSVGRNRGLKQATGRYIFFNDADDYLAPDALRRMVMFADELHSDVVVGRVRRVGQATNARPIGPIIADADLIKDRVWLSLGPMKLFRRALIERLGLVFPVDQVQGEDQVFVASCLFAAERISVLRDYDYYYRRARDDRQNLSKQPQTLRNKLLTTTRVTRLVVANTAPGARRERLLRRVMIETLSAGLRGPFQRADAEERREFLAGVQNEVIVHLTQGMLKHAHPDRRLRLLVARTGTVEDLVEVHKVLRKGLRYCVQDGVLAYDLGTHLNSLVEPQARAVGRRFELKNRLLAVEPDRSGLRLSVEVDLGTLPVDTVELVATRRGSRELLVLTAVPAGAGPLSLLIRPLALWAACRRNRIALSDGQRWNLALRARCGPVTVARSRLSVWEPDASPTGAVQHGGHLARATLRSGRSGMTLTVANPEQEIGRMLRRPTRAARRVARHLTARAPGNASSAGQRGLRSANQGSVASNTHVDSSGAQTSVRTHRPDQDMLSSARALLTRAYRSLWRTYVRRSLHRDLDRTGLLPPGIPATTEAASGSSDWQVDLEGIAIRFRLELTPRQAVLQVAGRDQISKRVLRSVLVGTAAMTRKPEERHLLGRWPMHGSPSRVRREAVERTRWLAGQLETLPHEQAPQRPVPPGHVLTYWWDYKPNFGDTIGPWLVRELTGKPVVNSKWLRPQQPALFTVGSVFGHLKVPGHHIWGSGVIQSLSSARCEQLRRSRPAAIHAVRGRLSRQELIEKLGWDVPEVYGDPALLLPRYYAPRSARTTAGKVAVVPHYSHQGLFARLRVKGTQVVDATEGLERVLDEIAGASHCVSTSLHGVIVAHAFGVPWTWLRIGDQQLHGDRFKFEDFFTVLERDQVTEVTVSAEGVKTLDVMELARKARLPRTTYNLDRLHDAFPAAFVDGS